MQTVFYTITTADWVSDTPWDEGKRIAGNAMKRIKKAEGA